MVQDQASKWSAVNHSLTLIGGTTKVKELLDFLAIPAARVEDTSATPPQAHRSTSYRAEFVQEARSLVMKGGGFLEMCCGKIEQAACQVLNLLALLVQKYTS